MSSRVPVIFAFLLACTRPAADVAPAEVPSVPGAPEAPGSQGASRAPSAPVGPSLAQKYAEHFTIGAAVDRTSLETHAALLDQHFNSVTAENEMKFESVEPTDGVFDFAAGDALVAHARAHGMKVRGHTLVW